MHKQLSLILTSVLAILLVSTSNQVVMADVVIQPPDLNPGDQYRLVFVTSGQRDADTDTVGVFNDFVTNAANGVSQLAALNTSWRAIISSTTFGANENIDVGGVGEIVPIYRFDGLRIANDTPDLFDGSILHSIGISELDTIVSDEVWTGTGVNGSPQLGLGHFLFSVTAGRSDFADSTWINVDSRNKSEDNHAYGISGVLTAQAVPEPATGVLFAGGLATLLFWRRRSHVNN